MAPRKKWNGGYCDRCNNLGTIECYCGGDLCVCGQDELVCPQCDGLSADPDYDPERDADYDF
jgi:hypothetical protein